MTTGDGDADPGEGRHPVAHAGAESDRPIALVVEDDPTLRETLAYNLAREGFRVREAEDGPGGVEAARRAGRGLAVVILDLMLPGMDGVEVLRRVRADPETAEAGIVVVSARADDAAIRAAALAAGADDVVAKPFAREDLLRRVRAAVAGRRTGG